MEELERVLVDAARWLAATGAAAATAAVTDRLFEASWSGAPSRSLLSQSAHNATDMTQPRRAAGLGRDARQVLQRLASDDRRLKHIVVAERRRSSINAHDQRRLIEEAAKAERRRRRAEVWLYPSRSRILRVTR